MQTPGTSKSAGRVRGRGQQRNAQALQNRPAFIHDYIAQKPGVGELLADSLLTDEKAEVVVFCGQIKGISATFRVDKNVGVDVIRDALSRIFEKLTLASAKFISETPANNAVWFPGSNLQAAFDIEIDNAENRKASREF